MRAMGRDVQEVGERSIRALCLRGSRRRRSPVGRGEPKGAQAAYSVTGGQSWHHAGLRVPFPDVAPSQDGPQPGALT